MSIQSEGYRKLWQINSNYTVYKIKCIKNGMIYIGCTEAYSHRIKQHLSELTKNRHYNKTLQSDFNKYGWRFFKASILDVTTKKGKSIIERYYIYKHGEQGKIYNKNNKCKVKDRKLFNLMPLKYIKLIIEIGWIPPKKSIYK